MTYTIEDLVKCIASQLVGVFPDIPVYASPNQQGTSYPCFFVFLMPSSILDEIDGFHKRDLAFDVVYVQARNTPDAYMQINGVADTLDEIFDHVTYLSPEGDTVPLHTHERTWSIEDQELHYKFHVKQRVSLSVTRIPMRLLSDLTINGNPQYDGLGTITGHSYLGMVAQRTAIQTVGG